MFVRPRFSGAVRYGLVRVYDPQTGNGLIAIPGGAPDVSFSRHPGDLVLCEGHTVSFRLIEDGGSRKAALISPLVCPKKNAPPVHHHRRGHDPHMEIWRPS